MNESRLLTPREAAKRIGVSLTAVKKWIHAGRLRTVRTAGGHHRVPLEALHELLPTTATYPLGVRNISCQNQLGGTIRELVIDGLAAMVVIEIENQKVIAVVTADEVRDLDLKPGEPVVALISPTSVMIGNP